MAVPKQRHTKSRRNKRRSHHALSSVHLFSCTKCGKPVLPHILCENCGTYKEKEVIDVLAKLTKRERKEREREQAAHEREEGKEKPAEPMSMEGLSQK